jgi:hypothetical protein
VQAVCFSGPRLRVVSSKKAVNAVLEDSSSAYSSSPKDSSSSEDSYTDEHFEILPEQRLDSIYLTVLKSPARRYRKQERKK